MRVQRTQVWLAALIAGLIGMLVISGIGVPEILMQEAAASGPDPEKSVDARPVEVKKAAKGAEVSARWVAPKKPVWPKAGRAEVALPSGNELVGVGGLPVKVGHVDAGRDKGGSPGKVVVETLAADAVASLGGVGVGARIVRADGESAAGKVRAEFSYAAFRDAFGGDFASRLQVVRLPVCVLQVPRARWCLAAPQEVAAVNDVKAGTLAAEVEVAPANSATADSAAAAARGKDAAAAQFAAGSVYVLAAGLTGPNGNWGATDLKPSGTWQAGTSGGGFDYDVPLPEPPSAAGGGPDLSLQYDASSVDGQGHWTNNQSGMVGVGWDLSAGFIERRYRRCSVDFYYDPNTAELVWTASESATSVSGRALCWESPDDNDGDGSTSDKSQSELVLSAGGRSAQIVKDRTSGAFKTVPDFGWRIEQVAGGADGQPYWKITTQDGQVWRFGYTREAQWQVPFVGSETGEPCNNRFTTGAIPPTCTGVWRWNLDQEADSNENVIDYTYTREINYFCMPSCTAETYKVLEYDRGGFLDKVAWGHNSQVAGSVPTARTSFVTATRGGDDVPTDLLCTQVVGCTNAAVAFYSTRKLASIQTESLNPTSGVWDPVDRLDLTHAWMYQRTDQGPASDSVMWLDTVQQTGLAADPQVTLPPLDFDAVMLAGKMDYVSNSDWPNQVSWRMVPRIAGIANGMGGRIEVTYAQNDPCGGGKGRDGSNYLSDKVGDCYDVDMGSDPGSGYEAWTRFYKQLATKVVERDMVGGSPDMVNAYEFLGNPNWTKPTQFAQPNQAPDKSEWRGYHQVRTVQGSGDDPSGYTVTSRSFFRGTGGQVTDFDNTTITDAPLLQGEVLQEQSWKMTALNPRAYTEVDSTRYEYTIRNTGNGPLTMDPALVLRTRTRARDKITTGAWRYTDQRTDYNADGQPSKVNDYGQDGLTTDNTCTTTSYARNTDPGQYLVSLPSVVEERAGDDCTAGALFGRQVTLYDAGTDPATNKPSDGNPTEVRTHTSASALSTVKATFDEYGRPLTSTDALNKTTTTTYTPTVGWPKDGITTTDPLGYQSTAKLSHRLGEPTSVTDANGKITEIEYDALGRTTKLWKPGQPSSGPASATAAYDIPWNGFGQPTGPTKTTIRQLLTGSTYTSTYSYEDGFGRTREAQTASPQGGRIVVATVYDTRGLEAAVSEPAHNTGTPGSGLVNPALTSLPQWTKTVYDDQERETASIAYNLATELRRTTTSYPGAERTEVTPPFGGKTATITDIDAQPVKVEEWADATTHHDTTYVYDLAGNLTKMTDAKGNVRTFTFDWQDQRTAATDPDAGTSSYGYDPAGNLLWSINGKGQKVSYTYDDLSRRRTQWSGEPTTGTKLAEWTYDTVAKGLPATSTRITGSQPYTQAVTAYDDDYQVTGSKVTIPASEGALGRDYAVTSAYDAAGNLREQTLPSAGGLPEEKLTYGYTDLGFAKNLTSPAGTYVHDTAFTLTGKLASRSHGTGGKLKRTLERDGATDWLSRVHTQTKADTTNPDTVQDDRYGYNVAGNITRILDAASSATTPQAECFTYDGLRRLKTAYTTTAGTCTGTGDALGADPYSQAFTYDPVGNIATLTDAGQAATYTYPASGPTAVRPNAVTSITRPGGTDTYAYDNAGQLAARTVGNKQATFDWNELGQLAAATVDSQTTGMIYDAAGERLIRRDPDGSTTLYLGSMELRLAGGQVTGKRYYTTSDGSKIAMRQSSGLTWLLTGQHGSTQLAVSDTTNAVSRERYLPYGKRRGGDDLPFTDLGFLGKTEDASTDLVYLGARYYDPAIAKFISTDPELDLRTPEWANPYSYAAGNPIDQSDPDGRRVDAGGGSSDKSYGYARGKQKNANQTFAKTHHASGKKKTKTEQKVHRKRHQQYERARKREAERARVRTRDALIRDKKEAGEAFRNREEFAKRCQGGRCSGRAVETDDVGIAIDLATGIGGVLKAGIRAAIKAGAKQAGKKACSSFVPGTRVLMADGTAKPIEKVKAGDKVLATDPGTGQTSFRVVTKPLSSQAVKNLVHISVSSAGDSGGSSTTLTATASHPFWVPTLREWVDAGDLRSGTWLRTATGTYVQVQAVKKWTTTQRVFNLAVADIHTYYVLAASTPVLVHNSNGLCGTEALENGDWQHIVDRHRPGGALVTGKAGIFTGKTKQVRQRIADTINRGTPQPNTPDPDTGAARPGQVYEWDFGTPVGRAGRENGGGELTRVRVVVDDGKVVTAFPY
ncbi:polymorphic toxin-type HINT domain-containing protein [Nonomuraea sp. NPDC050394]|uniref:polymorphic toxin-type HINT domain-containing protein n=1 Tax=Nonomuraea sp. NPDC050394 TaxID=3364363 RepID=UPI0037A84542